MYEYMGHLRDKTWNGFPRARDRRPVRSGTTTRGGANAQAAWIRARRPLRHLPLAGGSPACTSTFTSTCRGVRRWQKDGGTLLEPGAYSWPQAPTPRVPHGRRRWRLGPALRHPTHRGKLPPAPPAELEHVHELEPAQHSPAEPWWLSGVLTLVFYPQR